MILFLSTTEPGGGLNKIALEALGLAKSLGGELTAGLIGESANAIAGIRTLAVTGEAFGASRYSTDAAAAEALVRAVNPSIVIAPQNMRMARAMPGVAHRVSASIDTHVTAFDGQRATRWYYRQRMEGVLTREARPWFLLVESGIAEAFEPGPAGSESVEQLAVTPASRTKVIGVQSPKSQQQTIRPDAKLLFVTGAGWTKKQKDGNTHMNDAARLILGFLEQSRASLGSSKSLVDMGGEGQSVLPFLSHLNQVGQTGSTPRHPKGLATCCHGEEPHVVGWRFIKERRAINIDANCGWARGKADVVYVADAFAVMEAVNKMMGG
jgi:electron transfer flavoprotein alpha subunit